MATTAQALASLQPGGGGAAAGTGQQQHSQKVLQGLQGQVAAFREAAGSALTQLMELHDALAASPEVRAHFSPPSPFAPEMGPALVNAGDGSRARQR